MPRFHDHDHVPTVAPAPLDDRDVRRGTLTAHWTQLQDELLDTQEREARLGRLLYESRDRYNDLLESCISAIREYDGCAEGKIQACEEKGLVWRPVREYEVVFTVTCTEERKEDIENMVDAEIASGTEDFSNTRWSDYR
jgi:hypothetical protein